MASPQGVPGGFDRRSLNRRLLLGYAAIVALIFVGLYQFDQIVASIYAYAYGAFPVIEGTSLEFNRWSFVVLNIVLGGLFLGLVPLLSSATYPVSPLFSGYVWRVGQLVGSPLVIIGIVLIYKGWKEIVFLRGTVLVTQGIYSVVRHPQYLGFLLVTLGQFIVWPTIPTAFLCPVLVLLYYRQAKREEAMLAETFGQQFHAWASKTPMFLPKIRLPHGSKPVSP